MNCAAGETPSAAQAAPIPDPTATPMDQAACIIGMRVRPVACSTAEPSTLISTSRMPIPSPMITKTAATSGTEPSMSARPKAVIAAAMSRSAPASDRRLPSQCSTGVDASNPSMAPTVTPASSSPIVAVPVPRAALMAGSRGPHAETVIPPSPNAVVTVHRQRTSVGRPVPAMAAVTGTLPPAPAEPTLAGHGFRSGGPLTEDVGLTTTTRSASLQNLPDHSGCRAGRAGNHSRRVGGPAIPANGGPDSLPPQADRQAPHIAVGTPPPGRPTPCRPIRPFARFPAPIFAARCQLLRQQAGERVLHVGAFPLAGHQLGGVVLVSGEKVQPALVAGEHQVGAGAGDLG